VKPVAVIMSPLISLMDRAMANRNVTAVHVGRFGKVFSEDEIRKVYKGEYQLVFMSPESLLTESTWRNPGMIDCICCG